VNRTKPVTSRGLRVTSCARAGRGKSQISSTKSQTSLNSPMTQTQDILHSAICNLQSAIVPSSVSRPQSSVFTLHSSLSRPQSPVSGLRSIVYGLQSKVSLPRSSFFVPGSSFFPLPPSSFLPHPSPRSSRRIHPSSFRLHLSPLCSALCHFHFPLRILAVQFPSVSCPSCFRGNPVRPLLLAFLATLAVQLLPVSCPAFVASNPRRPWRFSSETRAARGGES
jgi:hypothetical protein